MIFFYNIYFSDKTESQQNHLHPTVNKTKIVSRSGVKYIEGHPYFPLNPTTEAPRMLVHEALSTMKIVFLIGLSIAAALGVIGGLIFVGIQLQQDRLIARTVAVQDAVSGRISFAESLGADAGRKLGSDYLHYIASDDRCLWSTTFSHSNLP